jgi:hypothetical protein
MKKKENDTITTNKEADASECTYEEEEEPSPFLFFPFPFILQGSRHSFYVFHIAVWKLQCLKPHKYLFPFC